MFGQVFVGGSGRSGTTIVAKLLGEDPRLAMIKIETRFLVDPGGLCDVVAGTVDLNVFRKRARRWFRRTRQDGRSIGLFQWCDSERFDDALEQLGRNVAVDRHAAARDFTQRVLGPVARSAGADRWIEMTPPNVARGGELQTIFPGMKLIHSMRDGRDVAASVARLGWGPNTIPEALDWWADRLVAAHRACAHLGTSTYHVVELEHLVDTARESTIASLFEFLELDVSPSARRFFHDQMTAVNANLGRWRRDVDESMHDEINGQYERLVAQLDEMGVTRPGA